MTMDRWQTGLPTWLRVISSFVLIVWGVLTIGRPFDAIELFIATLGIAAIATGIGSVFANRDRGNVVTLLAIGLVLIGLGCLWFRDQAIRILPIAIAGLLLAMGIRRLWAVIARRTSHPLYTLVTGIAWAGFGMVALFWPDVALLMFGFTIGPVAIAIGMVLLIQLWRERRPRTQRSTPSAGGASPGSLRTAGAIICAVLALGSVVATIAVRSDVPSVGAFYTAPETLPTEPGRLVRQADFTSELPENSRAWKILYTTPAHDGSPGVGSGMVYIPTNAGAGPFPVILWVHGTVGVVQECGPSLRDNPLESGAALAFEEVLAKGWAIVMPDYIGLGTEPPHPYLIGPPTARSSIDALRAAYQIEDAALGEQTVVWGHSQGGGTALWVGIEAQTYAPEIDLLGVVALSPATDLPVLADNLVKSSLGRFFSSFILKGYSRSYEDIAMRDYIRPAAFGVYEAISRRCLESRASVISFIQAGLDDDIFIQDIDAGPLRDRLSENIPSDVTGLPTFIGQGLDDGLILASVQIEFARQLCGNGQVVEYVDYDGHDHLTVVEDGSPLIPDVIAWTEGRFAGTPAATSCSFSQR
jgi:acetyl esterase/lipase/uncharacterized membrane protein HdeD (DUF308 family)